LPAEGKRMIRRVDETFVNILAGKMNESPGASAHVSPWLVNIIGLKKEDFKFELLLSYVYEVLGGNHSFAVRPTLLCPINHFHPCVLLASS
jgi:hypothetical protein